MADPSATLLDDFNRANEGPPPSANWTSGIEAFTGGLVVSSNILTQSDAAFREGAYWNAADFGPDVDLVVDLAAGMATENDSLNLFARLANVGAGATDGYGLFVSRGASDTSWSISRLDNNVPTEISANPDPTQAVAVGDQVALQITGSSIIGWHKPSAGSWAQIVTATDATYTAAGKVGVEITNGTTVHLDNFSASTIASGTDATVTGVAAESTASSEEPPKPRPEHPFSEVNLRL